MIDFCVALSLFWNSWILVQAPCAFVVPLTMTRPVWDRKDSSREPLRERIVEGGVGVLALKSPMMIILASVVWRFDTVACREEKHLVTMSRG